MSINPAANFSNLASLSAAVLSFNSTPEGPIDNLIQVFLTTETQASYEAMVAGLAQAITSLATGADSTLRILISISDGKVAYDSSKGVANNTWVKFLADTVNASNHNTRPEILVALLGNTGVGISERYSRSVETFQKYQANRYGSSTQSNAGTFRVSLNVDL
jgi:hypothetical protein